MSAARYLALTLAALLGAASVAQADMTVGEFEVALRKIDPNGGTKAACDAQVAQAQQSNGPHLFYGAVVCYSAKQEADGNFLMIAGQARSMVDLDMFKPKTEADTKAATHLYGLLFFQFGGAGTHEFYRNATAREALFRRYEAWAPKLANYDPGWAYQAAPAETKYLGLIAEAKAHRLEQMRHFAVLISDDRYYTAQRERDEIQKRNRVTRLNSADGKRDTELNALQQKIERELFPKP